MFKESEQIEKFEPKVWLSSPTMHGEEFEFLKEAYETNWMSTVGANINEVERLVCKKIGCKYAVGLSAGSAALHMAVKLAGVKSGEKVLSRCKSGSYCTSLWNTGKSRRTERYLRKAWSGYYRGCSRVHGSNL